MTKSVAVLTAILVLFQAPSHAEFSYSGYLKNIYSYQRSPLTHSPHWINLSRARLTLDSSASLGESVLESLIGHPMPLDGDSQKQKNAPSAGGPKLKFHVDYDHEIRTGSYFQSLDYRLFAIPEPPAYFDLDQTIGKGNSYLYRHRLYRAYAGLEGDDGLLRFGRQRVAWGSGRMWNPTDVLNPYDPTTRERDERRGVDSVYARHSAGALGQAEAAYALSDRWASTDLLGRVRSHWGVSDFSLMGGKVATSTSSWMTGGDFSSNLWDGNLHGEFSYTDLRVRTPYWRALIGYEYTFSSNPPVQWLKDCWVLAEYYRNGAGTPDSSKYNFGRLLTGKEIALARDYFGGGFSKDLHPLLKLELYGIMNLNDRSQFINPSLSWNAVENLHLSAGIQRFSGPPNSEYGRLGNLTYVQGQYFF